MIIWDNWQAFLSMGGYAHYVWSAFAITLCCIVLEIILIRQQRKQLIARLQLSSLSEQQSL